MQQTAPHKSSIPELRPAHKQPAACGKILVGSQTGTCSRLGRQLASAAAEQSISLELQSLLDYEPEQLLQEKLVLLIVSTYEDGKPPNAAKYEAGHLLIG